MSHEGVLYCKPHHQELFRPKAVINDILNEKKEAKKPRDKTQEILEFHKEQERRMETIIRENDPVDLGDDVVKCNIRFLLFKFSLIMEFLYNRLNAMLDNSQIF